MSPSPSESGRRWISGVVVVAVSGALIMLTLPPKPSIGDVSDLASSFRFQRTVLPGHPIPADVQHPVNPYAWNLSYYLYQVGASAALGDLDGDGLPNDLCTTDIRAKTVYVRPVPGTGDRYEPFVADLGPDIDLVTSFAGLCRIADLNEDGLQDILVGMSMASPVILLQRDLRPEPAAAEPAAADAATAADGASAEAVTPAAEPRTLSAASFVARGLLPAQERWNTPTIAITDVDGDGHDDLVIGNYFADGTDIYNPNATTTFEMNDSFSDAKNGGRNRVMLFVSGTGGADPTVSYADAGDVFPDDEEYAWTLAIGAADLDRDGLSDLYVANDFGPDSLYLNRSKPGAVAFEELKSPRGFSTPTSQRIGHDTFKSMGVDFYDLNGDDIFDMFVSNIASPFAMRESHWLWMSTGERPGATAGVAPWTDKAEEAGVDFGAWSWDTRFEDFDNDGQVELVQATGLIKAIEGTPVNRWPELQQLGVENDELVKDARTWPSLPRDTNIDGSHREPFYVLGDNGRYVDISGALYADLTTNARGIATGDVDGDGDIDMVFAAQWDDSVYLENQAPKPGQFFGLHVLLPVGDQVGALSMHGGHPLDGDGTPAIGAMVEMVTSTGEKAFRQIDCSSGHAGARSPQVLFGLGDADPKTPVDVTLKWRDRTGQTQESKLNLLPGWHTVVLGPQSVGANP